MYDSSMRSKKGLFFFAFSRRLRIQLLRFGPTWTHPHVHNTLIVNRGGNLHSHLLHPRI